MGQSKLVYGGRWVRVRNLMNKHFKATQPCSLCRAMKCAPVWFDFRTGEVRCMKCFTPEGWR
jgi:hypothetical protein